MALSFLLENYREINSITFKGITYVYLKPGNITHILNV